MEIKYTIPFDNNLILRLWFRFYRRVWRIILLFVLAYAGIRFLTPSPAEDCSDAFLSGFILPLASSGVSVSWYWLRSIFDKEEKPPTEYSLNDYGYQIIESIGESKTKWEYVKEVDEIKDYLLLRMQRSLVPVPKEVLTPESTAWIKGKVRK